MHSCLSSYVFFHSCHILHFIVLGDNDSCISRFHLPLFYYSHIHRPTVSYNRSIRSQASYILLPISGICSLRFVDIAFFRASGNNYLASIIPRPISLFHRTKRTLINSLHSNCNVPSSMCFSFCLPMPTSALILLRIFLSVFL